MTAVASRTFRSSPHRDTAKTWEVIVNLLTQGEDSGAGKELMSVAGTAACLIAEHAPESAAITVICDGPRTRIYCLYDEDALDGFNATEDPLGYDPLQGKWSISLPCPKDDLPWVQNALKAKSSRITARDMSETLGHAEGTASKAEELTVDVKAFLGS